MPNRFVVCDDAIVAQLDLVKIHENIYRSLRLYKSTMTPAHSSVLADFDAVEADFSGYAEQAPAYGSPVLASNRATVTGDPLSWTKSGVTGNTIYGYYSGDASLDTMTGAEEFNSAEIMTTDGDTMTVQPILSIVDAGFLNPGNSTLVLANEALSLFADVLLADTTGLFGCTAHLFKANITPSRSDTTATYTAGGVEADFSGYAAIGITWGTHVLVGDQRRIPSQSMVWTKSGATANTIYGYYILNGAGDLVGAKRYDSSASMTTDGQQHTLQMVYTLESEL